jgi:hypothetical protein
MCSLQDEHIPKNIELLTESRQLTSAFNEICTRSRTVFRIVEDISKRTSQ